MSTPAGRHQQDRDLQLQLPLDPFTLVIKLDAWNIRQRDEHWGQSAALRAAGQEPARWHWAYGGTCFRLNQRAQTAGRRPVILSRANEVLIVADGAVWIWNLAGDRFPRARQRVDFYHVSQHLWAVARTLHPDDAAAARSFVAGRERNRGPCADAPNDCPVPGRSLVGEFGRHGRKALSSPPLFVLIRVHSWLNGLGGLASRREALFPAPRSPHRVHLAGH